uniref:S1 RNA-binding domain-containing protein n=1 Tax=Accumulibacter sp. TaxID=2053492 RepID=UPI0028C4341B
PRTVVKAGDVVKVKVLEVDLPRQRIALSMRLADDLPDTPKAGGAPAPASAKARQRQQNQPQPSGAMASAFARLKR